MSGLLFKQQKDREDASVAGSGSVVAAGPTLVVAPRGHHSLVYMHCATHKRCEVPLNRSAWDQHVSFNVLHLRVSPDQRFLLAPTDTRFRIWGG